MLAERKIGIHVLGYIYIYIYIQAVELDENDLLGII